MKFAGDKNGLVLDAVQLSLLRVLEAVKDQVNEEDL